MDLKQVILHILGSDNGGKYKPDNSGKYTPDNRGKY